MRLNILLDRVLFASACTLALAAPRVAATTVCVDQINAYLAGSPLAGEGAHFIKWGKFWNVDPRLVVGIAQAESTLGRNPCGAYDAWGWACPQYFAAGYDPATNKDVYRDAPGYVPGKGVYFETAWEDGIFFVTRDMRWYYIDQGYTTVSLVKTKYCTSGCTNWIPNVTDAFTRINNGDPNSLDFPGEDCGGGGCAGVDNANLWVQFGAGGSRCGTEAAPFDSLAPALRDVVNGGTVHIKAGTGGGITTLDPGGKTVTLKPEGGSVTLAR